MNEEANTEYVQEDDLEATEAADPKLPVADASESVDDEQATATDEPMAAEDLADLIAADAETDSVAEGIEPDGADGSEEPKKAPSRAPGKRLSLKERLAARRLEEQGQESSDQEGTWYVLHTYSGYENKVKKTIETRVESLDIADRVYEIVVPTQEEIEIKNGQRQTVLKKVFPGYVLVRMQLDDETWYALRNTPGVTGFVNVDNKPVQLDESRVQSIMKGMVAEAPKVKVTFALGDTVRINDGPFADFRGEIDEINQEKGKIRVLVSFFGRETPVELDFLQAEREA